jgi:hypothetical protein
MRSVFRECAALTPAEIGVGLTGFGFLFTFLGVVFFFDKGLLAMGNVRLCLLMPPSAGSCLQCTPPAVHHLMYRV